MHNRFLTFLLLGCVILSSCVDKRYDVLNKEIETDVKIEGNKLALPVGSLKAVTLDSLIDVDDIEYLQKNKDGVYSFVMNDSISPIEESINPINLSFPPINKSLTINFVHANVKNVHIDAQHSSPAKFTVPVVSFEELGEKLPKLVSNVNGSVVSSELETLLNNPGLIPDGMTITLNDKFSLTNQQIACDVTYVLPSQVETIEDIFLTSPADNSVNGTPVTAVITNPKALAGLNTAVDFEIKFPDCFVLATADGIDQAGKYTLSPDKHSITVEGLTSNGNTSVIQFYIEKVVNVDNMIEDGVLRFNDKIVYSLDYKVNDNIVLTKTMKPEDFSYNLSMDVQLAFSDVKGKTKDFYVDFPPVEMDFKGHFDNLQFIDTIYYVDFEAENSLLKLHSTMETGWLNDIKIKDGYALKIAFPQGLELNDGLSMYNGKGDKVVYSAADHAFYVYDLSVFANADWSLALDKFNVNQPVVNGICDIDISAAISVVDPAKNVVDKMLVAGMEMESMATTLGRLDGEKMVDLEMYAADLVIKDASVHTDVIHSSLNTSAEISFCEEITSDVKRIDSIGFKKDVKMALEIKSTGLESIENSVNVDLHVALPSFLKLESSPNNAPGVDVTFEGDSMFVKTAYRPKSGEKIMIELLCKGLDFTGDEFGGNGLVPKDSTDGKYYLDYTGNIVVDGDTYIDGSQLHSGTLNNIWGVNLDVSFVIDEMEVKDFSGVYSPEIEEIEESVALDLGEELEFLREGGNTVTLAEPQIELVIENSSTLPVDIDMMLVGRDAAGAAIPSSEINTRLSIKPAKYDKNSNTVIPQETRLFITSDTLRVSKAGYVNVEVRNLATLLEKIPNSLDVKVKPIINGDVPHHLDITEPVRFTGSYSVAIPLKFDNFNICYSDTIGDINAELDETLDAISNVGLKLSMNVVNTLPLGLSLEMQPLDVDGNPIEDLTIDPIILKAGSGEDILNPDLKESAQKVEIAVKSRSGDISALDKIAFTVRLATDSTVGAVGIKGTQGLRIFDIVLELSGDIETDLGNLK